MQLTLHATRPVPHGASRLVQAMSAWLELRASTFRDHLSHNLRCRRTPTGGTKSTQPPLDCSLLQGRRFNPRANLVSGSEASMVTESWRLQGGFLISDFLVGATVGPSGSSVLAGYTNVNSGVATSPSRQWMAAKLDADGAVKWRWQGGTSGSVPSDSTAMGTDGSVVMAGSAREKSNDFAAVKLDADGNLLWEWQGGSEANDSANAVALTEDGSLILAGSTTGVWGNANAGLGDFAASKLDTDGNLVWKWQDGTEELDSISAVAVGDDASVVLAGYSSGKWSGIALGRADFVAVKLDADGNEIWRWQSGTVGFDAFTTAAMGQDGSVVLAGMTSGVWNGPNAGGYSDFAAVKLDARGEEIWRWQDGTTGADVLRAAAVGDDGSVVVAGTTNGRRGKSRGRGDVTAVKLDEDGVELWRWQGGSSAAMSRTSGAIALGYDGRMVLAGSTAGTWSKESIPGHGLAAVMLELGTSLAVSPSLGLPSDADAHATLAPTPTGLRATRVRGLAAATPAPLTLVVSRPTRSPVPTPPTTSSPGASATYVRGSALALDADALVTLDETESPTEALSTSTSSASPETATQSSSEGPTDTLSPSPAPRSVVPTPTPSIRSSTPSPTDTVSTFSPASAVPSPTPSPAPASPEPTSPAPASPEPTSPAPASPEPTSPAPSTAPRSPAPTPTPTSPAPTSPAPTSPAPTSPAPTSPAPTSPAPTSPAPTSPTPSSPAPTPPSPASTSPAPTPPASTSPAPTSPEPTSPEPTSPELISSPAPARSPAPTPRAQSPAPSPAPSPVPTSPAPTPRSAVPSSPEPTPPAPATPAPSSTAPTSPPGPPAPTPSPQITQTPNRTNAPEDDMPTTLGPTSTNNSTAPAFMPTPATRYPLPGPPTPDQTTPAPSPPQSTSGPSETAPNPVVEVASTSGSSVWPTTIAAISAAGVVAVAVIILAVCLRRRRNATLYNNIQVAPLSQRISVNNTVDGHYVAKEGAGIPPYLRNPSNTAVVGAAAAVVESATPRADRRDSQVDRQNASDITGTTDGSRATDISTPSTDRPKTGPHVRHASDTAVTTAASRAAGPSTPRTVRPVTKAHRRNASDTVIDTVPSRAARRATPRVDRPKSWVHLRNDVDTAVAPDGSRATEIPTPTADRRKPRDHLRHPSDTTVVMAASRASERYTPRTDQPKSMASLHKSADTVVDNTFSRAAQPSRSRVDESNTKTHISKLYDTDDTDLVTPTSRAVELPTPRTDEPTSTAHLRRSSGTKVMSQGIRAAERSTPKTDWSSFRAHVSDSPDIVVAPAASRVADRSESDQPKTLLSLPSVSHTPVVPAASRPGEQSSPRADRSKARGHLSKSPGTGVVVTASRAAERSTPRTNQANSKPHQRHFSDTGVITPASLAAGRPTPRTDRAKPKTHLRSRSDTAGFTAALRAAERSMPSSGQPNAKAQAAPAIDTIEEEVFNVRPVAAGSEIAALGPNTGTTIASGPSSPPAGSQVAKAVVEAACKLAMQSHCPGVCEAATLVSILVDMVSDDQGNVAEVESRVKRCRLVIMILERASLVLGKGNDIHGEVERMLVEDVQTAVGDMVELIRTYRSKKRLSQVIISTMFRRRMAETDAVIDRAIADLKLGLLVHAEVNQAEDRQTVGKHWRNLSDMMQSRTGVEGGTADQLNLQGQNKESIAESMASARRLRRQRNLTQVEIPEDHVTISDELLGTGGFGSVYIADYNGRNAAAKVMNVDMPRCNLGGAPGDDARCGVGGAKKHANRQRASLLLELQAMIRLRSPYTVNVYGAITTREDRLVLVMELLTGGDLRSFLKNSEERLSEAVTRQIIEDICAGMTFLHHKNVVHGDLKSANILLDEEGRVKIADFGTSRWAQHCDSTGLASFTSSSGTATQMMSFAWAAPEVLNSKGSSYASDVYSFGVVAWEVLSMEVPWADEALPFDIFRRVVFREERLTVPADAPADLADIVRQCWAGPPKKRPSSGEIMERLWSRKEQG